MNRRKVSIILPVYGQYHLLPTWSFVYRNLDRSMIDYQLIVVDDATPPTLGKKQGLRQAFGEHADQIICQEKNTGFAGAVNRGLQSALGEYVVLGNTDAFYVRLDSIKKQIETAENRGATIVGCRTFTPDGRIHHDGMYFANGKSNHTNFGLRLDEVPPGGELHVLAATGCGLLVRKAFFDDMGGLCTDYDGYGWEDADLCLEAQKRGKKVYVNRDAVMEHQAFASHREKYASDGKKFAKEYDRNAALFFNKFRELLT